MKVYYDFHIHSSLSPCADDDMTPQNIVAMASVKGLNAIAISDHNSIRNVKASINCGTDFGIIVIPAIEVQTSEEIHILALFNDFSSLERFYSTLDFVKVKNKEHIFGNQLVIDEDNKVIDTEQDLLITSAKQNIYIIVEQIRKQNGIAIPAHIDREQNGILAILGDIPYDLNFDIIELSKYAPKEIREQNKAFVQLYNSDAHSLEAINNKQYYIETEHLLVDNILDSIRKGRVCKS